MKGVEAAALVLLRAMVDPSNPPVMRMTVTSRFSCVTFKVGDRRLDIYDDQGEYRCTAAAIDWLLDLDRSDFAVKDDDG